MSKTITFTKPPDPVTDLGGSVSAGGSLAANTYYYVVLALGNGVTTITDLNATLSGISNEFTITTDATNKTVDLTWTAVAGASRYVVFRSTASGSYHLFSSNTGMLAVPATTNSYSDDGTSNFSNPSLPVIPASTVLPMGVNPRVDGVGHLEYYGGTEVDPITPQDIYDAAVADDWTDYCKWDKATLVVLGNFRPHVSQVAHLYFRNISFAVAGYFYSYGATGSRIRYGTLSSGGQAIEGVKFVFGLGGRHKQFWIGPNTEIYNSVVDSSYSPNPLYFPAVIGAIIYNNLNGGKGKDIMFRNYSAWFARADLPVDGLKLTGYFATVYNDCRLFSNIECDLHRLSYDANTRADSFTYLSSVCQINLLHPDLTDNFIDCSFPNTNEADKLPVVLWVTAGQSSTVQLWNSLLLKVLDQNNMPIEGATITVKDKDGNTVTDFAGNTSYITDATGTLFTEKITVTSATSTTITDTSKSWTTNQWLGYNIYISSGSGVKQKAKVLSNTATALTLTEPLIITLEAGDKLGIIAEIKTAIMTYGGSIYASNKEVFNPFEITISKTGYETYYIKKDITAKVNETIALKKAVPLLIGVNTGKDYLKLNPDNLNSREIIID